MKLLFILLCIACLSTCRDVHSITELHDCLEDNDTCVMLSDIRLTGNETWSRLKSSSGTIQGNRYTLHIKLNLPLFITLINATIENIKINITDEFRVRNSDSIGVIANKGINCVLNQVAIFGNNFHFGNIKSVGFLFGEYTGNLSINQISVRVDDITISSDNSTIYGGLIGKISESKGGYIMNSFINATSLSLVSNSKDMNMKSYYGGLAGYADNSIVDRYDYYIDSTYVHISEILLRGYIIYGGIIGYGMSVSISLSFIVVNKIDIYTIKNEENIITNSNNNNNENIPEINYYGCFGGYLIHSQVDDCFIYYQNINGPKQSPIVFGGFIARSDHVLVSNSYTRIDNLNIKRNSTGDEINEYIGLFTGIGIHVSTMRYYMDVNDSSEYGIVNKILDESVPKFDYTQYNGLKGGNNTLMSIYDITEITESYFTPETIEIFFPYFSFDYSKHWRFISPQRYPGLISIPEYSYDESLNYFIKPEENETLKSWDLDVWVINYGGIYPILYFSIDNCTDQSRGDEGNCFDNKLLPFSVCENDGDICNTAFNLTGICRNKICRVSCNNQSVCDELNWDLYCKHDEPGDIGICISCPPSNRFDNVCNNNERICKFQDDCLKDEICLWSYVEEGYYCQRSLKCDSIGGDCRMANGINGICSNNKECRPRCDKQYQCYFQHPQLLCTTAYNQQTINGYCETNCPSNITVSNYCFNLDRTCKTQSDCYKNETCYDNKCAPLVPCKIGKEDDYECEYNIDILGICYNDYCRHNCSENDQYDCYYHQSDLQCKEIYNNNNTNITTTTITATNNNNNENNIYKICDMCEEDNFLKHYNVCSNPIHSCHFTSDCINNETCDNLKCQIPLYCENDNDKCIFNDNSEGKCYNHICRPSCYDNYDCYINHAVDLECVSGVCIPCSKEHKKGNYCLADEKQCNTASDCNITRKELCINNECHSELKCNMIQYDNNDGIYCEYRSNISGSCYSNRCYPNCTLNSDCYSYSSELACGKDVWNCRKCNTIYDQKICNHLNVSSSNINMKVLLVIFIFLFLII